jgi:hypothetical protein
MNGINNKSAGKNENKNQISKNDSHENNNRFSRFTSDESPFADRFACHRNRAYP